MTCLRPTPSVRPSRRAYAAGRCAAALVTMLAGTACGRSTSGGAASSTEAAVAPLVLQGFDVEVPLSDARLVLDHGDLATVSIYGCTVGLAADPGPFEDGLEPGVHVVNENAGELHIARAIAGDGRALNVEVRRNIAGRTLACWGPAAKETCARELCASLVATSPLERPPVWAAMHYLKRGGFGGATLSDIRVTADGVVSYAGATCSSTHGRIVHRKAEEVARLLQRARLELPHTSGPRPGARDGMSETLTVDVDGTARSIDIFEGAGADLYGVFTDFVGPNPCASG